MPDPPSQAPSPAPSTAGVVDAASRRPSARGTGDGMGTGLAQPGTRNTGSLTQTEIGPTNTLPILRLHGAPAGESSNGPRVQWAENVVDNEGLGRKKSKVCCIYHRPRPVDESSDSDSSSSSSSSSSDADSDPHDIDRRGKGRKGGRKGHHHDCGSDSDKCGGRRYEKRQRRRPSPNDYERMPKNKPPGPSGGDGGRGPTRA